MQLSGCIQMARKIPRLAEVNVDKMRSKGCYSRNIVNVALQRKVEAGVS